MRLCIFTIAFIILSFVGPLPSSAQTADPTLFSTTALIKLKSIEGKFLDHYTDQLQQIYAITPSGQIRKYNLKDSSVLLYNDIKKFGKPATLDVNNLLRNVVFFKSSLTIAILDRLLTCRSSISLRRNDFFNVGCVANAYDNNIWIFDSRNMKLAKIDEYGKVLLESSELNNLAETLPQKPDLLFEYKQWVCLVDTKHSIYFFDRYGSYQKTISLEEKEVMGICKNGIVLRKGNQLSVYDPENPLNISSTLMPASISEYGNIKINNDILSVLTGSGIDIYQLK